MNCVQIPLHWSHQQTQMMHLVILCFQMQMLKQINALKIFICCSNVMKRLRLQKHYLDLITIQIVRNCLLWKLTNSEYLSGWVSNWSFSQTRKIGRQYRHQRLYYEKTKKNNPTSSRYRTQDLRLSCQIYSCFSQLGACLQVWDFKFIVQSCSTDSNKIV